MLRDAFCTVALTYTSTAKALNYKLDMWRNQSFPFNSDCPSISSTSRCWLSVLRLEQILVMLQTNCWPTLTTPMLGDFTLVLREGILCFQQKFGTCSIATRQSFHEPIIARIAGIVASKGICHHTIPVFGSLYMSSRIKSRLSVLTYYNNWVATSIHQEEPVVLIATLAQSESLTTILVEN